MARATDTELFEAAIPGQPQGSRVQYFVSVQREGLRVVADPDGAGALPYQFDILP
jgi:hypothetical protein